MDASLVDYQCQRYPLWDIHRFVEQVLSSDQLGFHITTGKHGTMMIRELPLAWHYRRIRSYLQRLPAESQQSPLIALFQECCAEMGVFYGFDRPLDVHTAGHCEADRYNALIELIRTKAATVERYKRAKEYVSRYDIRMFRRLQKYIDTLFLSYSKLLVVRLDLLYQGDYADYITLAQARRDIGRFVSDRRRSKLFDHCVGLIIAREHGSHGCGFHFHCFLFFNGQKRHQDVNLGKAIGQDYWEGNITRVSGEGDTLITRGRYFNCNAKQDDYAYSGIGIISHADEVKRANLFYALIYLTKDDQGLAEVAPPKTRSITRSVLPRDADVKRGRPRKLAAVQARQPH